jgi:pSer/pThr/pTyr-binding forkhead associated (FHA) protein
MGEDTIILTSPIGKRLEKVIRDEDRVLVFCGQRVPVTGKIVVGRDPSCDIVIDNKLVSKRHAMIQKIKGDFFVTDLKSTNGTFVDGERVPEGKYVRLAPGARIKIGKSLLKLS